jgi:hypothetical protein
MDPVIEKHFMTREFLESQLVAGKQLISQLQDSYDRSLQRSTNLQLSLGRLQDSLESWTKRELSEDNLTIEQANELAMIGDFSLAKTYDVTVMVEHTFTIEVSADETIEDVVESISYNAESYHADLINEDSSIADSSWEEVS